jgi:hypothetical protein
MGKPSGSETRVTEYRMSVHFGVCAGPVDQIHRVRIGEKNAWKPNNPIQSNKVVEIKRAKLFGGEKKEGGVGGLIHFLFGGADQTLHNKLAKRLKDTLTGDTAPGFRGLTTLWMTGVKGWTGGIDDEYGQDKIKNDADGFTWGLNNPYLKAVDCEVTSIPRGWYPERAEISDDNYKRRSIYISVHTNALMFPDRIEVVKDALHTILDRVEAAANAGIKVDLAINLFNIGTDVESQLLVEAADIAAFRTHVDSATNESNPNSIWGATINAEDWFDTTVPDHDGEKILVIIDQGSSVSTLDIAVADVATMTGFGVKVYCFSVDAAATIEHLEALDTTPSDGVPDITELDPSALVMAIESVLYPDARKPDANPAHIIFECLTNKVWGMGAPRSLLDLKSFRAAADTFYTELFGLSMMWTQQSEIRMFIAEVLDHVQATLFVHPRTGLLTLKPIRNDYDPELLQEINPDNASLENFNRKGPAEIVNEVVVTYTSRDNEEAVTASWQNLAMIAMQGGVISTSKNYYGIRRPALAFQVAARDGAMSSAELISCEAMVDRSAWKVVPGDVVKLSWPEHGISEAIMRVGPVDYGRPGEPTIKVQLLQDIFSTVVPYTDDDGGGGEWENPDEEPAVAAFTEIFTLPYFLVARYFSASDIAGMDVGEVYAGVLVGQTGHDTAEFELTEATVSLGTRDVVAHATLANGLAAEVETALLEADIVDLTQGDGPAVGVIVVIGEGTDNETEIELAEITAYDSGTETYTLKRGILDTVPRAWAADVSVWFLNPNEQIEDATVRASGESPVYEILTITSLGTLSPSLAPDKTDVLTYRPHLPNRPADVKVEGVAFNTVSTPVNAVALTDIAVTWANRNRLTEETVTLAWDDADVTPEGGQTTTITTIDTDTDSVIDVYDGLTGTSYDIPAADLAGYNVVKIRVTSKRDELESMQGHELFVRATGGYGYGYGYDYGG